MRLCCASLYVTVFFSSPFDIVSCILIPWALRILCISKAQGSWVDHTAGRTPLYFSFCCEAVSLRLLILNTETLSENAQHHAVATGHAKWQCCFLLATFNASYHLLFSMCVLNCGVHNWQDSSLLRSRAEPLCHLSSGHSLPSDGANGCAAFGGGGVRGIGSPIPRS